MFRKLYQKLGFARPKRLFSRSLIFIAGPIIFLQIIIGILIVQRYFDRVTEQLVSHFIIDLEFAHANSRDIDGFAKQVSAFDYIDIEKRALDESRFGFADLSGRYILQHLEDYKTPIYIDSRVYQHVLVSIPAHGSNLVLNVRRSKLTPTNPHQILLNTMLFSIFLIGIALLFMRNQTRPIFRLAKAAEAYGRGDIIPYSPRGAEEVRTAGRSFLAMRSRIERQREQRMLMLSGISHDLRTPLTRMRLSAEMIEDDNAAEDIKNDISEIENMIDSFLDYAANNRLEETKTVDIDKALREIVKTCQNASYKGNEPIMARIKPVLFSRAISNLLSNSTRLASKTELNCFDKNGDITIIIDDNGPGIDPADREPAMKAFTRLDHARNQDEGAHVGLGLAIAADAIRQHAGTISLENSPLGGLRVRISMPSGEISR